MFIVVEGIDGSGKTTVSEFIFKLLEKHNMDVILGAGLGSGTGSEKRRNILKTNKDIKLELKHELLKESLISCSNTFVKPYLSLGKTVVLDRYTPSFYAYQLSEDDIEKTKLMYSECLSEESGNLVIPDLYIYCDVELDVSLSRIQQRMNIDNMDQYFINRSKKIYDKYSEFFNNTKIKTIRLDTNRELDVVLSSIEDCILKIFNTKNFEVNKC